MKTLRSAIIASLDKIDALLKGEPVRLILYSSAAVVYATVYVLNGMGITRFGSGLSFEAAVLLTTAAISLIVLIVERVRMFVYSPQTYIEDLSDAVQQGHIEAHAEEAFSQLMADSIARQQQAQAVVAIGTAKAAAAKDAKN